MKVKALIKELQKMESLYPDKEILFSNDEEGNTLHVKAEIAITNGIYDDEEKTAVVIFPLHTKDDIGY